MTRRQTAIIVFIVLCVVLVAAAVSLNVGWILVSGRRLLPLSLSGRPDELSGAPLLECDERLLRSVQWHAQ
jgi:hypothetical protein